MKRSHRFPGLWVNFEANEGAGKGTQQKLLERYFEERGYAIQLGREPGSTLAGEEIRKFLQDPNIPDLNPRTEMLLYVGAGIEFYEHEVKPALESGKVFMSDRWR